MSPLFHAENPASVSIARRWLFELVFRTIFFWRPTFTCPLCGYRGPFKRKKTKRYNHVRDHAKCPACRANERERLQYLVTRKALDNFRQAPDTLHVAPERVLSGWLKRISKTYTTADLFRKDVDVQCDIEDLPFDDASFDLVYASHVLVYARDDRRAIAEIRRILRPGGIAVLPVPIVAEVTSDPEGRRFFHEPGLDYPDRFREVFDRVETWSSSQFGNEFQLYFYERLLSPDGAPIDPRPAALKVGPDQYEDLVPLCFVES